MAHQALRDLQTALAGNTDLLRRTDILKDALLKQFVGNPKAPPAQFDIPAAKLGAEALLAQELAQGQHLQQMVNAAVDAADAVNAGNPAPAAEADTPQGASRLAGVAWKTFELYGNLGERRN